MTEPIRLAKRLLAAAPFLALAACGGGDESASGSGTAAPAAFAACASCHSVEPGQARGAGPNLHGIVGRTAGTAEGFVYSKAMQESGLVWSPETLDRFLAAPTEVVPGTRMVTRVTDPARRQAVIDYLATLSPAPAGAAHAAPSTDEPD